MRDDCRMALPVAKRFTASHKARNSQNPILARLNANSQRRQWRQFQQRTIALLYRRVVRPPRPLPDVGDNTMSRSRTLTDRNRACRRHPPQASCHPYRRRCHALGLGRTKLYQLITAGDLKTVRVGGRRLVLYPR